MLSSWLCSCCLCFSTGRFWASSNLRSKESRHYQRDVHLLFGPAAELPGSFRSPVECGKPIPLFGQKRVESIQWRPERIFWSLTSTPLNATRAEVELIDVREWFQATRYFRSPR